MEFIKSIYYFFYFMIIKGHLKNVLSPYLNDKSKISISYLNRSIAIKNYKINLIKDEILILNYLNKSFDVFNFDKVITKTNKIIYKSEKTPLKFVISPKKQRKGVISIGATEDGVYQWEPGLSNSMAFLMAPGVGKTYTLKKLLKNIELYHLGQESTFQEILIVDLKNEGDFDFLINNQFVKIYNTQLEVEEALKELEYKADMNTAKKTLVLAEEYLQLIINGDKKSAKNIARILQKIHSFMRSKGIALIITTQYTNADDNELSVANFIKIISSPSESYARSHSIPFAYCNRSDLIFSKYLISFRAKTKCIRM